MLLTSKRSVVLPLIAGVVIGGLIVAFGGRLLGRRSSASLPPSHAPVATSKGDADDARPAEAEGGDQEIRLEEAAQRRAGIRVAAVGEQAVPEVLIATGEIEPSLDRVVKVTSRVGGRVRSLFASVGDAVAAGQPLLTLDSPEVAQGQATLKQANARLEAAGTNLQRQKQLAGLGEFTSARVEAARAVVATAEGDLDEATSGRRAAQSEVDQAESAQAAAQSDSAAAGANITEGDAAVAQAKVGLGQAQAAVELARAKSDRAERLFQAGVASKANAEEARAERNKAMTDVDAQQAAVRQSQARLEALQAAVHASEAKEKQAANAVAAARAHVAQLDARVQATEQRLKLARQALAREERIFQGRYLASKEVAEAEAAVRQASIDRDAALDALRLLGAAAGGGSIVTVAAPIAGRVQERNVTLGESIDTRAALFGISNLTVVWAQLDIQQSDLPRVAAGQAVTIRAAGLGRGAPTRVPSFRLGTWWRRRRAPSALAASSRTPPGS